MCRPTQRCVSAECTKTAESFWVAQQLGVKEGRREAKCVYGVGGGSEF